MKNSPFILLLFCLPVLMEAQTPPALPNPIIFVSQIPVHGGQTVTHSFANHEGGINLAPRGGDLMMLYPDGRLRNLTREAGFGESGVHQGDKSIAVRQPTVHWSGKRALFSMVIGANKGLWDSPDFFWQIYEVTGLDSDEPVVITKISGQLADYNNIAPVYGSDDSIFFTSDMPITLQRRHYPPLDEYENMRVVSGLWKLAAGTGELSLMEHSPSGSFNPVVDSYGRVLFTRWDHLQRDQQVDLDRKGYSYGTFNWSSEAADAVPTPSKLEVFPEIRDKTNPEYNPKWAVHNFNHFFPWEINQDGTEEETVNHVGRQEWGGSHSEGSVIADKNLNYVIRRSWVENQFSLNGSSGPFNLTEDPNAPGIYYAINAPEFGVETAGQLIRFNGGRGENPEKMVISSVTHRVTSGSTEDGKTPNPDHTGKYRNPLMLTDGRLVVSHSLSTFEAPNSVLSPDNRGRVPYNFRLKFLKDVIASDGKTYKAAAEYLTPGIVRSTTYYNASGKLVSRTDTLWELEAQEVRARAVPPLKYETPLATPERSVFEKAGVNETEFRNWMKARNLALIVSRNITSRDRNDLQQPFNLKVTDGVQTISASGSVYEVKYMQLFQADLLRSQGGAGGHTTPRAGRRVLAQPMHAVTTENPAAPTGPAGSVKIATDGSVAAFVPARRALSWQLTEPSGEPVVKERYWLTFQPGEIRTCASCHGVNTADQIGAAKPINEPAALKELLEYWQTTQVSNENTHPGGMKFELTNAFPNPFNGATVLTYSVPANVTYSLHIFNALGQKIQTLIQRETGSAAPITTRFDAANLPSGVYFARLESGTETETRKIVLLK